MVQSDDDQTRITSLLAQAYLTDLGRDHGITFLTLRSNECSTCSLLKHLCITVVYHSQCVSRYFSLLSLIIAEQLIFLSQVKFLHPWHQHLCNLLLLYPLLYVLYGYHLVLSHR